MKKIFSFMFLFVMLILGNALISPAQKKKKPQTEELRFPPMSVLKTYPACEPVNDRAFVVIAQDGELSLGGKKVEIANLQSELVNYICDKLPSDQIIYIKAGAETPFSRITEVVRFGRKLDVDNLVLMLDSDKNPVTTGIIRVPAEDTEPLTKQEKADPLTLAVAIMPDGKIELNGKAETSASLAQKLKQTFKTRAQKRIYVPGSREILKTVFVYADSAVKFGDVLEIIKEIEKTDARLVGLDVDDYYLKLIF